ncbi:microtubule-associated protein futsch-like isoform X2 [Harmonia axyridis]|uniref:microtubule-associated protein futsch-like isoform X2 n=1 Tax=Harmonia axyridis TaxID=115357 RepID=UPI001E274F1E|nr:microtubule-associated protein futsch-like isoform X2 [Harmonia axyridis]
MSAINERAISNIKDEDLLKKMWQETEDFGKKKEIRAHMYKLREERLKDLYSSSDVKDVHMITNKKSSFNQSMHADALADHSFASLKRKEIRDSESPTKDVSYRMKGPSSNEGWNISKIEERSQDGKNHRFQQTAHTSGTELIPQGKLDFEAKNSQEVTSFQDGDQNNFVKSQGASSNSFIRQEAVGGDGNSSFRTSSTQSSSSSRKVTEQRSTYGDAIDYPRTELIVEGVNRDDQKNSRKSSTCADSSSVLYTEKKSSGNDVSNYPRREILLESTGRNDQSNFRTSSSNTSSSMKTVTEQKSYDDHSRKPIQISDDIVVDKTTKVYTTDAPRELKSHPGYVEGRTKITRETKTLADGTVVTTTKYETSGANEQKSSSNHYTTSSSTFQDNKSNVITSKSHEDKYSTHKNVVNQDIAQQPKSRYYVEKTHTIPSNTESIHHNVHSRRESNVSEKKIDTSKNYQTHVDERYEVRRMDDTTQNIVDTKNTENVKKQVVQHIEIGDRRKDNIDIQKTQNIRKEVVDNNKVQQKTIATHDVNSVPLGTPIEIEINLTRINDNQERRYETQDNKPRAANPTPSNVYDTPQKREPIKHESELKTKNKRTEGNYDTTYKTDYTNKKISVEVSPTHDAFARSLRAVSPDRLSSRTNSRNLKTSNSSLRSSSSPEKSYTDRRHSQRMSPEGQINGRCYSPTKKSPEKYSSTETITYRTTSRPSTQRISPDKNQRTKPNEIKITSNISTTTRKTEKLDNRSPTKNSPRSSRPNYDEERTNVQEIITDLDDNVSTYSHSTVTRNVTDINTISVNDHQKRIVEKNSVKEPVRKDKPVDKPLKRTDTYEERCRQILGITGDTNEKRRSSIEKLRKRGSTISSHTEFIPKTSPEKTVDVTSSKKSSENPRQSSPAKQGSPLQEFPSQIRRSPEKYTPDKKGPKENSPTKNRKTSVEHKPVQEFPSQKRRSPEKPEEIVSPTRSSPRRTIYNSQERKPSSEVNPVQEYPSQKQKSPEKYHSNVQEIHTKTVTKSRISDERERSPSTPKEPAREYPSQRRPSPEKQDKQTPKKSSSISRTPDKRERSPSTTKETVGEYPSQTRPYPEKQDKQSPYKSSPSSRNPDERERSPSTRKETVGEYPSQTRPYPEKQDKQSPNKSSPRNPDERERSPSTRKETVGEYPSQTRPYPEKQDKQSPNKSSPSNRNPDERERSPSTRKETVGEYPSQTRPAPEKQDKQSPNKSSPSSRNPDERGRSPSTRKETVGEYPSQTRPSPGEQDDQGPNRNSPRTITNNREDISIYEVTSDDQYKNTTNITYQIKNDVSRNENLITEVRKSTRDKKPINKKPGSKPSNEESSSEEETSEINESQETEEVVYDIPRNTPIKNFSDITIKTDTLIITTDGRNKVDVKKIITDYVSEDEQIIKNYQVENVEVENEKPRKIPEKTKPDQNSYPKPTSSTRNFPSQDSPTSRNSPKKTLPCVNKDVKVDSPKQLHPIEKDQSYPKPRDTYDKEIVEENENIIETSEKTTTDQSVIKMKTVGELVKNFTVKGTEQLTESTINKRKPTDKSPTSSLYKKPTTDDEIQRTIIDVEISETSKRTPIDSNICRPTPKQTNNYQNLVEDSEHVGFVQLQRNTIEAEQVASVTTNTSSIDDKKRYTSNQVINVSPSSKKPVQNDKTRRPFDSEENRPEAVIDISKQRIPNQTISDDIIRRTAPKTKTQSKKPSQWDNNLEDQKNIDIEIEETIIIESDEEITKPKHKKPATKKITDNLEFDEEIDDIREDNYTSEHKLKINSITKERKSNEVSRGPVGKTPNKNRPGEISKPQKPYHDSDTEVINNDLNTRKVTEQKVVHTSSRNTPKEKDSQKPTQRIPSSSSLSKKPVTPQRIDKYEDLNNKRKTEVSTATSKIQSDQKLTKIDSVKSKNLSTNKTTNEISSKTNTIRKPTTKKPVKDVERNKKPSRETPLEPHSDYSSEAEEEILTKQHIMESYEGRTPVDEPLVKKKTMSLLYSDDEDDKKTTQLLIESEITDRQPITNQKKIKPVESTKTKTTKLISTEKHETIAQKTKSPLKSSPQVNNQIGRKPIIEKKPEISKQTHSIENKSNKRETVRRENKQNTLKEIEKFENITQDKTVHLRSNRVDDTVNKKKTTVITESNKPVTKYPKVANVPRTTNGNVQKTPSSRNIITIEKKTTKTREPATLMPKTTKPSIQHKNTTSSKTITQTKSSRTSSQNIKTKTEENIKSKSVSKKLPKPEDSDEESLPDSLNENISSSIDDLRSKIQKNGTRIESNVTSYRITSTRQQPEDSEGKVKIPKSTTEKKHIPKKSVINNSSRGATIDLQRSISSREATPDRMCPLPVTSDEEGFAPRYPDTVVEPDEGYPRRRYDKLLETSIHEYDDSIQSKKIVEINEGINKRVSEIDRVDNDDDSLLTVDRKINKFLNTAEKLTEKPIVDISQPAPKVERPKFVVNDDLKEDDCLLSVSDKVQKFITEAEHLTTQKDSQHRKSISLEKHSEISNKINQFTAPQQPETHSTSPRKFSVPKSDQPSGKETYNKQSEKHEPVFLATLGKTKLDQDVFITTECAEIEKEADFDRTSKRPSQSSIRPNKEPEHPSPKITSVSKTKTINSNTKETTSSIRKTSTITTEISDDDSEITDNQHQVEDQRDTSSKPRKNSLKEFTPKNRRPSQEDKVILSSVGRLRSNESIQKAKALFENTDSIDREEKRQKDILNRPSVFEGRSKSLKETNQRKSIDRTSVTPKRLDFSSEKDIEDNQEKVTRSSERSQTETRTHIRSNVRESLERDIPGYMKPLDRSSTTESHKNYRPVSEDDLPKRKHPDQDDHPGSQTPGYMKPLDRSHQHTHNQNIRETHESKHSISHEDIQRYHSPNQHKESDDTPGYMKPLDRSHQHSHNENSQTRESHESRHSISHETQRYSSPSQHRSDDDTPGYMKPLDRSHQHSHNQLEKHDSRHSILHGENQRYRSPSQHGDDDIPGYMKPLDRSSRPQFENMEESHKTQEHHEHRKIHKNDHLGYMEPLDRSSRPQFDNIEESHKRNQTHEHHDRRTIHRDDHPGYMEPLDRSARPQFENFEESLKRHETQEHLENRTIHKNDHPGYMEPLDRSSKPQFDNIEESHKRNQTHEHHDRRTIHRDDHPGYMEPLDRSSRPQFENFEESLKRHETEEHHESRKIYEDDHPGYMKPLDRSSRPQFDNIEDSHNQSQEHHERRRIYEDDHPDYMQPLDRSVRPNFDRLERSKSPETHTSSSKRKSLDHEQNNRKPGPHQNSFGHKRPDRPERTEVPGYMKPLDRSPQVFHRDSSQSPEREEHRNAPKQPLSEETSPTPSYMKPVDRSTRPQSDKLQKPESPAAEVNKQPKLGDKPNYMKSLDRKDRTSRSQSPKKDVSKPKEKPAGTPTKFGVTLKRTDSGRSVTNSTTTTTEHKHYILMKKTITEEEIEEVYDLDVLEELLLKFTTYELRRKIRSQIRLVKKLISENKLEITIQNIKNKTKTTDQSQKIRETEENSNIDRNIRTTSTRNIRENQTTERNKHEISEYRVESTRKESVSSTIISENKESRRSQSPEKKDKKIPNRRTPERATPERSSPERKLSTKSVSGKNVFEERTSLQQSTYRNKGKEQPEEPTLSSKTTSTNIFKSSLKKTEPKTKTPTSTTQPEWITQRNLKKTSTNEVVKKSSSSSTTKKQNIRSSSSQNSESTDLIQSSYGIGPTDENGAPLFGLRALRAQNGSTKVHGTVMTSQYYSETGKEPVGEISYTEYSSDPRDLGVDENSTQNGEILSITTTQKYGYDDSPSLSQLTSTKKETCDSQTQKRKNSTKTSTITRKNSVKALTQKFVENAVEVSKNERQSSYPKAGLILRSSSFKNESAQDDGYSEISAEERIEQSVSTKSSNSKTVSGGTFLRNKSKVTGVHDAISRMQTEDIEYGDTSEDIEAKDLLNKYLGTQVILSGIEGQVSRTGTSSTKATSFTTAAKSTSRVTIVTMENGKEVTRTLTFEHPVTEEVLENVWDEQTLRYLLDQSTDYEERKRIRARLRHIMAEQEACTELVKQASQDQSSQSIDEVVETSREIVSEGPVTTTKVTKVSTQQHISKKPMSPFAKFRQLDKQNSLNTPPSTPRTPGGSPLFKFTDAALSQSASTIKDRLLYWCRMKTKEYENIQLDNFSSSWADGLAFCALVHHFLPDAFDYHALTPKERRHNFTLAFKVADEKADIAPLLDVDDMVATMRPDWKCVFTYVQSIYRRFKDED